MQAYTVGLRKSREARLRHPVLYQSINQSINQSEIRTHLHVSVDVLVSWNNLWKIMF